MEMVYKFNGTFRNPLVISPKDYEVVNVSQRPVYYDSYDVKEYPTDINGRPQSFHKRHFRPLDEVLSKISIEELTHQLVEK